MTSKYSLILLEGHGYIREHSYSCIRTENPKTWKFVNPDNDHMNSGTDDCVLSKLRTLENVKIQNL